MRHRPRYFWENEKPSMRKKIKKISFVEIATYVFLIIFFSNLFSVYVLFFIHPNMLAVHGNPRPLYLYDIDPSCNEYDSLIVSSLTYLSDETGVKFVRLPSPFALISGGLSYSCKGILANPDAIGESESGTIGISYFVISWNRITVLYPDRETILHETLHSMSFGHSDDKNSIMYPYQIGSAQVDADIVEFIRMMYVNNPFAYLNVVTLNLLYITIFFIIVTYSQRPNRKRRDKWGHSH